MQVSRELSHGALGVALVTLGTIAVILALSLGTQSTLSGLLGVLAVVLALAGGRISGPIRLALAVIGVLILAFGGWLDLNVWDSERAKPSPRYLGPAKY